MASYFTGRVADRLIKVATGTRSQTVNICTPANALGTYEAIYRLPITSSIQSSDLSNRGNLQALCEWLEFHNGRLEHRAAPGAAPALAAQIAAPRADDEWVQQAVGQVERVISRIVNEFIADPLMHRVEHSLHARIWSLLTAEPMFKGPVDIGKTGRRTQLVHKEWPETIPEPYHHRGLFDLAVLSPQQLEKASLKQFRQGRLDAPIVIEVGLDYGYGHLHADHKKVLDSKVPAPYLIHLSRIVLGMRLAPNDCCALRKDQYERHMSTTPLMAPVRSSSSMRGACRRRRDSFGAYSKQSPPDPTRPSQRTDRVLPVRIH